MDLRWFSSESNGYASEDHGFLSLQPKNMVDHYLRNCLYTTITYDVPKHEDNGPDIRWGRDVWIPPPYQTESVCSPSSSRWLSLARSPIICSNTARDSWTVVYHFEFESKPNLCFGRLAIFMESLIVFIVNPLASSVARSSSDEIMPSTVPATIDLRTSAHF